MKIKKNDNYDSILHEAAKLFRRQGFAATTTRQIATAVGVSQSVLYNHFANKQEIMERLLLGGVEQQGKAFRDISEIEAPIEQKLRMYLRQCVLDVLADTETASISTAGRFQSNGLPEEFWSRYNDGVEFIRKTGVHMLEQGIVEGKFVSTEPGLAMWGFGGMVSMIPQWYRGDGPLSPDQIADFFADTFLNGLLVRIK